MQLGFYGFEHSALSRGGFKAGGKVVRGKSSTRHASAVASYMSNVNKVGSTLAVNLPTERGELYSELNRHSASITRKNGRIAETFIIWFDKRMTPEHQDKALGRFLMAVTFQGRTRAEGWRHIDKPHNPHAHAILIDVDENGEPVAHFSRSGTFRRENSPVKGNPTVWLRQVWQDECNNVLEQHGYDFRIDRRSKLERSLAEAQVDQFGDATDMVGDEPPPGELPVPELEEFEELDAPECPPMQVEDIDIPPYPEASPSSEEAMVEKVQPSKAVHAASEFYDELRELRVLRAKLEGYTQALASSEKQLATATAESHSASRTREAADKALSDAESKLQAFQNEDASLKGFGFSVGKGRWKLEWKSALRKRGEAAQERFDILASAYERAESLTRSTAAQVERWENARDSHQRQKEAVEHEIAVFTAKYGEHATLDSAERILEHSAHAYIDMVEVDELIDLYETGQISPAEFRDALELKGETDMLEEVDKWQEATMEAREEDGDEGLSP